MAASFGVMKYFSLDKEPYKSLNNTILPTNKMLKMELVRRVLTAKTLRERKIAILVILLNLETFEITNENDIYLGTRGDS